MKYLLPLLLFVPIQSQAITWNQFWKPFRHNGYYYAPQHVPYCTRQVYREEYVHGDYWRSGYTRGWWETVRVPCY